MEIALLYPLLWVLTISSVQETSIRQYHSQQVVFKSREYRVYTRNWLKLLPSLNSKEQWQLHWKDVIDEDDDSMFAE